MRTTVLSKLRQLLPPITPGLILRAILGAILFLCGILYGMWLIIRFRRRHRDQSPGGD